jgi:hypothetical protein
MRDRCNNPKNPSYHNYGGRGISVCERWDSFANFLADMGERPDGFEIDRRNNDGNYEPSNCHWISRQKNLNNTRDNRLLEFQGEVHTLSEWAQLKGMLWDTLRSRLRYGWTIERALTEPVKSTQFKEQ